MRTKVNAVLIVVMLLLLSLVTAPSSHAALQAAGPVDAATCAPPGTAPCGFPAWYQDPTGLSLAPCFDTNGFCPITTGAFPNPALPFGPTNFPDEGFYYFATANAGPFLYIQAVEFAFGTLTPTPGQELTFARTRVDNNAAPLGTYTVTHPYGVETIVVDALNIARHQGMKFTNDLGLGGPPFTGVLTAGNTGPYLRCAGGPGCVGGFVTAPDGNVYIGNGVTPTLVTGTAVTNVTVAGPLTGDALGFFILEGKVVGMSATPTSITFPAQRPTPVASAPVTVTVKNLDSVNPLILAAVAVQGANAADFTLAADLCSNKTVAANGTCTFNVVFSGAAAGPVTRTSNIVVSGAAATVPKVTIQPMTGIIDAVAPTIATNFPTTATAPANTSITVTFSEAMDPLTITGTSFTLLANGAPIPGLAAPVYSAANKTASIALPPAQETALIGKAIAATVTTGVTDVVGNPMASAATFTFTAAPPDRTPPLIASVSVANNTTGVRTDQPITVTFSEPMLATNITGSTIKLTTTTGAAPVDGTVTLNNAIATFTPTQPLKSGTAYTLTVAAGALDLANNALATGQTTTFVTNFVPVAPSVVSPANGATAVARPVTLRWQPSTDQDQDTVQYHLSLCNNQDFIGAAPNCFQHQAVTPTLAALSGVITYAGVGSFGIVLALLGMLFGGVVRGKGRVPLVLVIVMMTGVFLYACGGGSSAPAPPPTPSTDITFQVSGLSANVTYFWKMEADDGKGGVSATPVMTFTTQ